MALLMVTAAGLPMWKHCSKAVTLGMPLQACQIMSKADTGEGKKKEKKELLEGFIGQKYKTSLCSGRKQSFYKVNFLDILCLRGASDPVPNQGGC